MKLVIHIVNKKFIDSKLFCVVPKYAKRVGVVSLLVNSSRNEGSAFIAVLMKHIPRMEDHHEN